MVTNVATTTNCTMIRIRLGTVLRNNEITKLANAVMMVTERPITIAGSNWAVTANAEQIPSTCTVTGLFNPSGVSRTSWFFLENKLIFYSSFLFIRQKWVVLFQTILQHGVYTLRSDSTT